MPQIKEPYGLVYNTDGSVCVTYRDDDIPFPGVRSFAVETATTNYCTDPDPYYGDVNDSVWIESEGYYGTTLTSPYLDLGHGSLEIQEGDIISCSFEAKLLNGAVRQPVNVYGSGLPSSGAIGSNNNRIDVIRINLGTKETVMYSEVGYSAIYIMPDGNWYKFIFIFRPTGFSGVGNWRIENTIVDQGAYLLHRKIQFEKKPFASSFVVGSRPKGRLVISVDDLKFDIANDDWVISYWKYPVATEKDNLNSYNLCSLGQYTSNWSKGYIDFGKEYNMNKYRLVVILNDATSITILSDNTFNPNWYFRNWHYEVLKKQGKVLSYYVDGVKQCEATIPADKKLRTPFDVGLSLGGNSANNVFYPHNSLIAAPYYGYNSATWTDEYIREVYEAKIPYPAQNKLSIY